MALLLEKMRLERRHSGVWIASSFVVAAVAVRLAACVGDDPGVFVGGGGTDLTSDGGAADGARDDGARDDDGTAGDGGDASTVTCDAPLEACGSACVDKQSSAQHCGRCDRACGTGSSCSAGRCSTVTLVDQLDTPTALAVSPSVVVMSVKRGLVRCGKEGCSQGATRLWQSDEWQPVEGSLSLSPDGAHAFLLAKTTSASLPQDTNLYRATVDGTPPLIPALHTNALSPAWVLGNSTRVATDAREHVFVSPYRNHRCFQASCSSVGILSNRETPSSITLTPTHYAWTLHDHTGGATVQTCPRPPAGATGYDGAQDCGTPIGLAPAITATVSGHITLHDNVVYWADWGRDGGATARVLACAPTGCNGAPKVIATAEQVIDGLVVDATGAYWTNGSIGTVRVCRDLVAGCGTKAETLASGATNPGPIRIDDTNVHYVARGATPTAGALLKVAK